MLSYDLLARHDRHVWKDDFELDYSKRNYNNESLNIHMNIFKTGVVVFWIDKLDTAAIS